jgi:hypothetical protein
MLLHIIVSFLILVLVPHDVIMKYLGIKTIPDRYWFIAIPTHLILTILYILILIKGISFILTDEPPVKIGKINF